MSTESLFRSEAVQAVQTNYLGSVVLARPIPLKVFSIMAGIFLIVALLFVSLGSYTKRTQVFGQLLPQNGLIKLVAPQSGVVVARHVEDGETVTRGQVLYTLSSERISQRLGDTQQLIIEQLIARRASLQLELQATESVQADEAVTIRGKIAQLEKTVTELHLQYSAQRQRVRIAEDIAERYTGLLQKKYITKDQLLEKQADHLDQLLRLQSLTRELDATSEELAAKNIELGSLPQKQVSAVAQIKRALVAVEQELTETEAKRQIVVVAPQAGVATGVLVQVGQAVEPAMPLLSIVPSGSPLVANLYAPSRTIGFVKIGDPVLLRYAAYPYQKFGQYAGTVKSVSGTSLSIQELSTLSGGKIPGLELSSTEELYYRIMVELASQNIQTYGARQQLKAGMVLEANIAQENRKIYEWILDPLYSLHGNLQSSPAI